MSKAEELRLADVETFISVVRYGSINGAARTLRVTPSQVSKAIARLERQVAVRLLARGTRGVMLTDGGQRLFPSLADLIERAHALRNTERATELMLIASTYLTAFFLPHVIAALPDLAVHSMETAPGVPSAYAGLSPFDVALTTGNERWPASWQAVRVGTLRKALYASQRTADRLGARVTQVEIADETFIGPIYSDRGRSVSGDDGCPLPSRARRFGHRTQTVALALELARDTSQLVFAPEIAARSFVQKDQLVEIEVEGWNVREPLLLVCHQERVLRRVQNALLHSLRAALRA